MYENIYPEERFNNTLKFMRKHLKVASSILDLGVSNPFTKIMEEQGHNVLNTDGSDLDFHYNQVNTIGEYEVCTAFEILEHLISPMSVIKELKCDKLFVTVPLNLWFTPAYRSKTDKWDRHFHEFEDWQMDWLLEKAGWDIVDKEKWIIKQKKIGFRPFLRNRTPRYYAVYAERVKLNN